jgi:pimeloyl-ACP methyl ester carboxylesterase
LADWAERLADSHSLSGATSSVLVRYGLLEMAERDPARGVRTLESALAARPDPDGALALAELSYQAGLRQYPQRAANALGWYRDAAVLAAFSLSEPRSASPNVAVRIHNGAVARMFRLARQDTGDGGSWRSRLGDHGLAIGASDPYLDPQEIAELRVASDLKVRGMEHLYGQDGLGVPLVARRVTDPAKAANPGDQFVPRELMLSVTAAVVPSAGFAAGTWRNSPATLVLFDPFAEHSLNVGQREIQLAADRTTALAALLGQKKIAALAWMGLLESTFGHKGVQTGLYMPRPYEPGKIPVVLVHGLVSSPTAWVQTINELRNTPELSGRYQFWVFMYPTGLPIPSSAAQLRAALSSARETVDPTRSDPALDQMVLVGHSMGGIISKMMVQDSGMALWNASITVPRDRFKAPADVQNLLDSALIYRPLPFVRRVVFVASPHRGSPLANDLLGRVISSLVRPPGALESRIAELEQLNGRNVISRDLRGKRLNAIGNLRTDSPILAATSRIPIDPTVPYHSIIASIGGFADSDGVVQYESSHIEGMVSEKVVAGNHSCQAKPEVSLELRRILLEHLQSPGVIAALNRKGRGPSADAEVRQAGAPSAAAAAPPAPRR